MAVPVAETGQLEFDYTGVAERTLHSIFSVEATPLYQVENDPKAQARYNERIELIEASLFDKETAGSSKSRNAKPQVQMRDCKPYDGTRNATGFVVARSGSRLRILTCAHVIDECYAEGVTELTVKEVNLIFRFDVTCTHEEMKIHDQLGTKDINEEERVKAKACCVALDTHKDLMVLRIENPVSGSIGEGDNIEFLECLEQHPAIPILNRDPYKLEACILNGWPPQSMECYYVGHCSFSKRTYSALTQLNSKGYNMKLVDLSGMVALDGCSGGPIINSTEDCLGVYHGVINEVRGYAVSPRDINVFLEKSGMLFWPNDDEDDEDDVPAAPGMQADVPAAPGPVGQADVPAGGQGGGVNFNIRRSGRSRKPNVRMTGKEYHWS